MIGPRLPYWGCEFLPLRGPRSQAPTRSLRACLTHGQGATPHSLPRPASTLGHRLRRLAKRAQDQLTYDPDVGDPPTGWSPISFDAARAIRRAKSSSATIGCWDSRQGAHDLCLPVPRDCAIAREGCQHVLVAKILAPGLELLGRLAELLAKTRQRLPKAVGVEVGQARLREGGFEDLADRTSIRPVLALYAVAAVSLQGTKVQYSHRDTTAPDPTAE
jgi:hypothetical protein